MSTSIDDTFHEIREEHRRWEALPPEVRGISMYISDPYGAFANDRMKNKISREECLAQTLKHVLADLNHPKRRIPILRFAEALARSQHP